MSAAVGIVHDFESNSQKIYGGRQVTMTQKEDPQADQLSQHRDDILCLDLSLDRTRVVTGQIGKFPSIHVWDAVTCEKIDPF